MTARMRAAGALVLVLALGGCGAVKPAAKPASKPKPKPAVASGWVLYTNSQVGVTLRHPQGWQPVQGYLWRIGGKSGYVQLNALSGAGWTARQAVQNEVTQHLHPFGTDPTIAPISAAGQAGYLILPSQNVTIPGAPPAEVVLPYPKAQTIDGTQYHFLIIDATASLIRRIVATLQFAH